jgi:pimeloyl-ACP methyl ester carboxylesterase
MVVAMDRPVTRYARTSEGVHIGYQVVGDGDVWLLNMKDWGASVDGIWEHPGHRRLLRVLGSVGRVVLFDPRGVGVSDPVAGGDLAQLENWVVDALTVLDEVGAGQVRVLSEGFSAHVAVLLAVTRPERVSALTIMNGFARLTKGDGYPHGVSERDVGDLVDLVRRTWGTGAVIAGVSPALGRGKDAVDFCAARIHAAMRDPSAATPSSGRPTSCR